MLNMSSWHRHLLSKQERWACEAHKAQKKKKRERVQLRWGLHEQQTPSEQHTRWCQSNIPPSVASARSPPTAHFSALIHRNKDQTRKGRRTEAEGRQRSHWRQNEEEVRTACNTSCRDLSEDKWAPGSTRWEQRTRETHTSITETNRLPSALVAVPSLSQLKNKGGDNREQLVTFRKLKSRMLLATKKAKCTL